MVGLKLILYCSQVEVSRHVHFPDAERAAVANLRAEVKRQCVKTRYNPQGAKVGYMEPKCIQVPIQSAGKRPSESSHAANWICIPYFSLHQYSESPSTSNVSLFPEQVRTGIHLSHLLHILGLIKRERRLCCNPNIRGAEKSENCSRQSVSLGKFNEGIAFTSLKCGV